MTICAPYGTILVNLQQGRPIDILADRATETVATWFRAHSTVEVVARDRAEGYAASICHGYAGKAIARQLGIGKSTVFRYLRTSTFPERK